MSQCVMPPNCLLVLLNKQHYRSWVSQSGAKNRSFGRHMIALSEITVLIRKRSIVQPSVITEERLGLAYLKLGLLIRVVISAERLIRLSYQP